MDDKKMFFNKQDGMDVFEFLNGKISVYHYIAYDDRYEEFNLNGKDVENLYEKMKEYFDGNKTTKRY